MDALLFSAGGLALLTPLADLDEVLMPVRLQPLAGAPPYLAGVFNLRGATVPVLDLAPRLGRPVAGGARQWRRGNRILRFGAAGVTLGVIVAAVGGIRRLRPADRHAPVLAAGAAPPCLGDLWLLDGQLTQAIDLTRLLTPAELAGLAGVSAPPPALPAADHPPAPPPAAPAAAPDQPDRRP